MSLYIVKLSILAVIMISLILIPKKVIAPLYINNENKVFKSAEANNKARNVMNLSIIIMVIILIISIPTVFVPILKDIMRTYLT